MQSHHCNIFKFFAFKFQEIFVTVLNYGMIRSITELRTNYKEKEEFKTLFCRFFKPIQQQYSLTTACK